MNNKFNLKEIKEKLKNMDTDNYSGFRFIACLDDDTCIICAGFDNTIISSVEEAEVMEKFGCLNEHCRCLFTPAIKGDSGGDFTYSKWFRSLPVEEKKEILGDLYDRYKAKESIKNIALSFTDEMAVKYIEYKKEMERLRKARPVVRKKRLTDEQLQEYKELLTIRVKDVWTAEEIDRNVERIKTMKPKDQHSILEDARRRAKKGAKK